MENIEIEKQSFWILLQTRILNSMHCRPMPWFYRLLTNLWDAVRVYCLQWPHRSHMSHHITCSGMVMYVFFDDPCHTDADYVIYVHKGTARWRMTELVIHRPSPWRVFHVVTWAMNNELRRPPTSCTLTYVDDIIREGMVGDNQEDIRSCTKVCIRLLGTDTVATDWTRPGSPVEAIGSDMP